MSESESGEKLNGRDVRIRKRCSDILEDYKEFREFVREVALRPDPDISESDPEVRDQLSHLNIEFEEFKHAYAACIKLRAILQHPFIDSLIKAGYRWRAELGTEEKRILCDNIYTCIRNFFISTGSRLLVKKRGSLGLVYYFGWYETKPLIMRTVPLLEYSMTSDGYLIANSPFEEAVEAIRDYLDIQ